ncbi:GTPase HflX, partial [Rothia mucilaginosa]
MTSKNNSVSEAEKLPSDEQLRRTVDRVLGRSQSASSLTTYDAAGTAHHESAPTRGSRRVLDTRAREISDVQREHSEFDG